MLGSPVVDLLCQRVAMHLVCERKRLIGQPFFLYQAEEGIGCFQASGFLRRLFETIEQWGGLVGHLSPCGDSHEQQREYKKRLLHRDVIFL